MAALRLIVGNLNYSSWSLRAFLMAARTGERIELEVIPLGQADSAARLAAETPAGLVPVLQADGMVIWDTLAIGEYLAETYPDAHLWPDDIEARAIARAVSAEMHAGFATLRSKMPMDMRSRHTAKRHSKALTQDISRIVTIWRECRARFGEGGPYLFGRWSIADAMYAPVVSRFKTYGVAVDEDVQAYMDAVWAEANLQTWLADAEDEPWGYPGIAP